MKYDNKEEQLEIYFNLFWFNLINLSYFTPFNFQEYCNEEGGWEIYFVWSINTLEMKKDNENVYLMWYMSICDQFC